MRICLASQSLTRHHLVKKLIQSSFLKHKLLKVESAIDERDVEHQFCLQQKITLRHLSFSAAKKLALHLAKAKREAAIVRSPKNTIVIGCDQLLFFQDKPAEGQVLGKPGTYHRAHSMLRRLSGKRAFLITAMSVNHAGSNHRARNSVQVMELRFAHLKSQEIEKVLLLDRPYGCAGSFKFEGHGANLFESVKCDDPTGIQGISVMRLRRDLQALTS